MSWSHFEACVDQQRYVPLWAVLRQGAIQKHRYDWTHRSSPSSHTSRAKRIQFESIPVKQLRAHSGLLQVISNSWCRRLAISPLFQGAGPNPKTYDPMICSQGHQNSWRQSHTLRVVVRWKRSREKKSIALCMTLSVHCTLYETIKPIKWLNGLSLQQTHFFASPFSLHTWHKQNKTNTKQRSTLYTTVSKLHSHAFSQVLHLCWNDTFARQSHVWEMRSLHNRWDVLGTLRKVCTRII